MESKINLSIVDDHPVVIQGIKNMLQHDMFMNVATAFTDGKSLMTFLENNRPDLILMDITLPDIKGIELCLIVKKKYPEICIIMLSNRSERSIILQCVQNGASGYLLKNSSVEELSNCIRKALSGDIVFCSEVKEILNKPSAADFRSLPRLTKREKEILNLVTEGKTSNSIAKELFLSPLTVETHRRNLMQKFDVKNTAELIREAIKNNII